MHLLLVEDDPLLGKYLTLGLEESQHHCMWAQDGRRGYELAHSQQYDAIILDLKLPGQSGLEVLRGLRAGGIQTPVLVLTASGSTEERVIGLKSGADDYLVKPFALAELLARLDAISRRVSPRPAATMQFGQLVLDMATRRLAWAGKVVELTPTEFSVLEMLLRHRGQVVTRRMLCYHLWDQDWEKETNIIDVHINRLRKKLQSALGGSFIETVRGKGYAAGRTHETSPQFGPET